LIKDKLYYILAPQDVYSSDFPSEIFRVLKEKEIKEHRIRVALEDMLRG
jgi:hypothetical protein